MKTDLDNGINRRDFLQKATQALLSVQPVILTVGCQFSGSASDRALLQHQSILSAQQFETLKATVEILLPSEPDAPGAKEVNAADYISAAIAYPDFDEDVRSHIVNGLDKVLHSSQEANGLAFAVRTESDRELWLRSLVDHHRWAERWVSVMITYTLEAVLSDPIYGGNPDQIGWRWLNHQPGFPLPPFEKRYDTL